MNYNHFILQMKMLKSYRESKEDLKQEIDDIIYQYCGVKGIQYNKEPVTSNPYLTGEKLIMLSEALEEPQRQLEFAEKAIAQLEPIVNENLDKLPEQTRDVMIKLLWEKKTFYEIGKEIGYTQGGLWKRIKKEISKL